MANGDPEGRLRPGNIRVFFAQDDAVAALPRAKYSRTIMLRTSLG